MYSAIYPTVNPRLLCCGLVRCHRGQTGRLCGPPHQRRSVDTQRTTRQKGRVGEHAGSLGHGNTILLISSHLGFVHLLQDVALHQCLPSSSVCCLPNPGGSLLLCYASFIIDGVLAYHQRAGQACC